MEDNHKLCLYVSYYLSRFNFEGLAILGYGTWESAFNEIGNILNVNPHTVKNMRDQFDPLHGHRVGWYQVPLSPSRLRVAQALENLEEFQIRELVQNILSGEIQSDSNELEQLLNIVTTDEKAKRPMVFVVRGPTGRAAEEYFEFFFHAEGKPISGNLSDCRDFGIGYDYKIESEGRSVFIEVKGLSDFSGGILLTSKEWDVAKSMGEDYYICIVSNLDDQPKISFIQNPFQKIQPTRNIFTTIQINWSVTKKQLEELHD